MPPATCQGPKSHMELVAIKLGSADKKKKPNMPTITESSIGRTLHKTINGMIIGSVFLTPWGPSANPIFSTFLTALFQSATSTPHPCPMSNLLFSLTTFHHLVWNLLDFFPASPSSSAWSDAVAAISCGC